MSSEPRGTRRRASQKRLRKDLVRIDVMSSKQIPCQKGKQHWKWGQTDTIVLSAQNDQDICNIYAAEHLN